MSEAAVVGWGPVTLVTSAGQQISIPLTALYFDSNGALQASRWPLYSKYQADVDPWLKYLVKAGDLTSAPQPPPATALMITAADPGPAGNNIKVTFSNITPDPASPNNPATTTFDALVVETDTYTGLSYDSGNATAPNFIKNVLGTETIAGSQPGLVHLLDAEFPVVPPASPLVPVAGVYPLTGGNSGKAAILVGPAGTAFTVQAKKTGTDGNHTTVTISSVDGTAKTFSLLAVWSETFPGIKLSDLQTKFPAGGYEIAVTDPTGGTTFNAIPVAGVVTLTGGAAAQVATAARATVYAS